MSASRRALVAISAFNLFRGAAIGLYQAVFPMYMVILGYNMRDLGLVISASSLIAGALSPLMGSFIERKGAKNAVSLTGALLALSFAILVVGSSPLSLFSSYLLFFASFAFGQPARAAYLAYSASMASLGAYIGLSSMAFSLGRMLGPGSGGFIAGALGFTTAFLAGLAVVALATASFYHGAPAVNGRGGDRAGSAHGEGYSLFSAYKRLALMGRKAPFLYLTVAVDRFAWTLWFPMLSAHLYASGLGEELSGLVLTVMSTAQTLSLP
ncbi:MAG: MFS transporter, partial [Desulfurococcales archaeon]|nr:MFS transporter [Desulfurococcales archaeon]